GWRQLGKRSTFTIVLQLAGTTCGQEASDAPPEGCLSEHSAEIAGAASPGRAGAPDGPGGADAPGEGERTGEADDSKPSGDDNEDDGDVGRGDGRAARDAARAGDEGSSRRPGGSPQDLTDGSEQRKLTT